MSTNSQQDQAKIQTLIELFTLPVVVVNNDAELVASNVAYQTQAGVAEHEPLWIKAVSAMLSHKQDMRSCVIAGEDYVLNSSDLEHGLKLIKIARSQPSALAKRYQNLVAVVDQLPDAVVVCSDNKIDLVNEKFESIFDYSEEVELCDMPVNDFLRGAVRHLFSDEHQQAVIYRYLRRKFAQHRPCTIAFNGPDGHFYEYRDTITYTGGRVGLIVDESQFKALNEQLELAFDEARQLSDAKSNFLAAMSHEVRTPLNSIIGLLDLCQYQPELEQNELVKHISNSAHMLLRLLNDVLDYSKFDSNQVELNPHEIALRPFCETIIKRFYGQAKRQQAELSLYVDPNIPVNFTVDELRLNQVLSNLIGNGLKFNKKLHPAIRLEVGLDELTQYLVFKVIDNGIGISDRDREQIFDQFTQANSQIHSTYGGTGLGLSICRKITELMLGDIYVESEVGKGSMFVVQLPLETSGPIEVEQWDLSALSEKTVLTNSEAFYTRVQQYAVKLGFKVSFVKSVDKLKDGEVLFLDDNFIFSDSMFAPDLIENCVSLTDELADNEHAKVLQLTPICLHQLLGYLYGDDEQAALSKNAVVEADDNFAHIRVLVVEDNTNNMYLIKRQMHSLGINASYAMSAEDAIIFFEQQRFDVVISDYRMPKLSGAELTGYLRQIEQDEQRKKATIIILTADKSQECVTDCTSAGADQIVIKPLVLEQMTELIRSLDIPVEPEPEPKPTPDPAMSEFMRHKLDFSPVGDDFNFDEDDHWHVDFVSDENKESIFDPTILHEMLGILDTAEEREYLDEFYTNVSDVFAEMEQCINKQEWESLTNLTHNLKSNAQIVGAFILSSHCEKLELALIENKPKETIIEYWQNVKDSLKTAMEAIASHKESL